LQLVEVESHRGIAPGGGQHERFFRLYAHAYAGFRKFLNTNRADQAVGALALREFPYGLFDVRFYLRIDGFVCA
jgi:hypothetical protein